MLCEIAASANTVVLLPPSSVLDMESEESAEIRGEMQIQKNIVSSPSLLPKFFIWFLGVKNSGLKTQLRGLGDLWLGSRVQLRLKMFMQTEGFF